MTRESIGMEVTHRVAVIGAGCAGLKSAKTLRQSGFEVTVFEAGSRVGGLWWYENDSGYSSAYRTLHINTAKNITAFSDLAFPSTVQTFPSHEDMHRYLEDYARHFELYPVIRLKTKVVSVEPVSGEPARRGRWLLTTASGVQEVFDFVVVCSGHLSTPMEVGLFRDGFTGEYLHSHYYREPDQFVGKRICIVGAGNSAVDIASDVCVTSARTVLVARSGVVIAPKMIMGIPLTDITMQLHRRWIPGAIRRSILRALGYIVHGKMERYGFKPLTERTHPTTSATIITDIAYSRVDVKQGIACIDGERIRFEDGTEEEFDVLIAATGYSIDIPLLSRDLLPITHNSVDLYKRIVSPDWPGLYFIGMLNANVALNWIFENQIRWLLPFMTGEAELPTSAAMHADIRARRDRLHREFRESARHTIEEEHVPYFRELKDSLKVGRKRAGR